MHGGGSGALPFTQLLSGQGPDSVRCPPPALGRTRGNSAGAASLRNALLTTRRTEIRLRGQKRACERHRPRCNDYGQSGTASMQPLCSIRCTQAPEPRWRHPSAGATSIVIYSVTLPAPVRVFCLVSCHPLPLSGPGILCLVSIARNLQQAPSLRNYYQIPRSAM